MAGTTTVVTLLLAPVLVFFLWHMTASAIPPVPSNLRNKRIILLIAHPDDESMFFSPTLQALTTRLVEPSEDPMHEHRRQ